MNRNEGHIYVNLNQYNNSNTDQYVNLTKIYSEVLLPNPSEYEMSVIRFDFYGLRIPIINLQNYFVGGIAPTTILEISMIYNNITFTRPLIWTSFSSSINDYLYYDYNHIAVIFNNALNLLTSDVNAAFPGTIAISPRIEYDPLTTRYVIYADKSVFGNSLPNPVQLWLNTPLYELFHSLPYSFSTESSSTAYSIERIFFGQVLNVNSTIDNSKIISGIDHWGMVQETQALISMNSAKSIVLTSDLPIVEEYISNVGVENTGGNTATVQYPIVSDFLLDSPNGYEIFNKVVYLPTAEYRMLSLSGSRPIQSIKLKMFWTDSNGNLNPLILPPKRTLSVKIMFRKKDLYNKNK
jgi:hypothetical protein